MPAPPPSESPGRVGGTGCSSVGPLAVGAAHAPRMSARTPSAAMVDARLGRSVTKFPMKAFSLVTGDPHHAEAADLFPGGAHEDRQVIRGQAVSRATPAPWLPLDEGANHPADVPGAKIVRLPAAELAQLCGAALPNFGGKIGRASWRGRG